MKRRDGKTGRGPPRKLPTKLEANPCSSFEVP